ncbi:hypothetical protein RRG08_039488 [Elysia crispata]|uniref:Uncharacterized protein n=1 Tax=Elysia crispata TaxID=231223 RepID=A0AAE0YJP0_9GAST|nr:hypothetical protein RRG08_039488 [Elysia crispata]
MALFLGLSHQIGSKTRTTEMAHTKGTQQTDQSTGRGEFFSRSVGQEDSPALPAAVGGECQNVSSSSNQWSILPSATLTHPPPAHFNPITIFWFIKISYVITPLLDDTRSKPGSRETQECFSGIATGRTRPTSLYLYGNRGPQLDNKLSHGTLSTFRASPPQVQQPV